jgi:hypothetical protein
MAFAMMIVGEKRKEEKHVAGQAVRDRWGRAAERKVETSAREFYLAEAIELEGHERSAGAGLTELLLGRASSTA